MFKGREKTPEVIEVQSKKENDIVLSLITDLESMQ